MKTLKQYINEEFTPTTVSDVKVVFDVSPEEIYIAAPGTYSESDIQIFLHDVFMMKLPSENDKYKNLLGKNRDEISDAYFEYDSFTHEDSYEGEYDFEVDSHYDDKVKEDDLETYKITGLKYIILFDEFEILDKKTDDVKGTLDEIFTKLDSSELNEYPAEIKYNPDLLEFEE